nr:MAG TPA: hypothetical protein [Inoviridae sp.]
MRLLFLLFVFVCPVLLLTMLLLSSGLLLHLNKCTARMGS